MTGTTTTITHDGHTHAITIGKAAILSGGALFGPTLVRVESVFLASLPSVSPRARVTVLSADSNNGRTLVVAASTVAD